MMQTFLPAFEAVVVDSKIRGIMCAYNSVNGVPLCANELLQKQLRERMGFEGIVITDCGAIGMMTGNHHWNHSNGTAYTPVEATAAATAEINCKPLELTAGLLVGASVLALGAAPALAELPTASDAPLCSLDDVCDVVMMQTPAMGLA